MKQYTFLQEIFLGNYQHKKHEFEVHIMKYDSGNKFHCHIIDKSTLGSKFHTCIELLDNRYYWHNGKTGVLDSKHRNIFNEFLKKKYNGKRIFSVKIADMNNWQALCLLWNETNAIHIPVSTIKNISNIRDYTYIKPNQCKISRK